MKYIFRCIDHSYSLMFEVEQRIMDEHTANCPICGKPAQRVYTPITHYFNDCLYHMDGSKQDSSELPAVYGGMNKFFSGF